jgi:hypothetical protein
MIAKAPMIETTNPHISVSELVQQTNITILIQEQVKSAEPQVPVKIPEQSQQASPTPEQSVQSASKDVENNPASGDANQAKSSKPGRKTETRNSKAQTVYIPRNEIALKRWKKAWRVIKKTREEYAQLHEDNERENPNPKIDDLRTALFKKMKWKPSERTVYRIIAAGNEKLLD